MAEELIETQWLAEAEGIFTKLAGGSVLGQLRVDEVENAGLGNVFDSMDVDQNGCVTVVEWTGYLKSMYQSKESPEEAGRWMSQFLHTVSERIGMARGGELTPDVT